MESPSPRTNAPVSGAASSLGVVYPNRRNNRTRASSSEAQSQRLVPKVKWHLGGAEHKTGVHSPIVHAEGHRGR